MSVVVPSYNHAAFVESALRSIFRQKLLPAELLVIDDGSADGSPQVIETALKNSPVPCEFMARANRGLSQTLNEGLGRTRGEYFAYLASDDLWLPDFLSARVALLRERRNAVLAYGHAFYIDDQDHIIDCTSDWAGYVDGDAGQMLLVKNIAPMSSTVVYDRAALERHGWNEQARLEDYELYLRLSADGEFAFDPRVLSAWRWHESNTSRDTLWMLEARLAAQRSAAEYLHLNSAQLQSAQRALRFAVAEDLLRLGKKFSALQCLRQGWRGAPSAAALGRILFRFILPSIWVRRRREGQQGRAQRRYGQLPL
ncbi:MAG: glycosyltransferase [Acidobacteriia bacterium]|nr:glycosyltransferase [Terriglobia bacterium]